MSNQFQQPIVMNGAIYAHKYEWQDEYSFHFSETPMTGWMKICEHTITAIAPEDFDPVAAEMLALQEKKQQVVEEFSKEIQRINERVTRLLALSAPTTDNGMEVLDAVDNGDEFI